MLSQNWVQFLLLLLKILLQKGSMINVRFILSLSALILILFPSKGWSRDSVVGFSYQEGTSITDYDLLDFDSKFSASDNASTNKVNFKTISYRAFIGFRRGDFNSNFNGEFRLGVEHLNMYAKENFNAKCLLAPNVEFVFPAKGSILQFHTGLTWCDSQLGTSEVYILDTSSPTMNPYQNSMHKYNLGAALTSGDIDRKFGFRLKYDFTRMALNIRNSANTPQYINSQSYGLEFYFLN